MVRIPTPLNNPKIIRGPHEKRYLSRTDEIHRHGYRRSP